MMAYTYTSGDTKTTIVICDKSVLIRIENIRTGECISSIIPPSEIGKIKKTIDGADWEIEIERKQKSISQLSNDPEVIQAEWDRAKSIIDLVIKEFSVTREALISEKRTADIVRPRHTAFYLIRKYTELSLLQTSGMFDKHYTAVVFGVRALMKRMIADDDLLLKVNRLEGQIEQENGNGNNND